jgi:protein O-mannosyl-transferase
MQEIKLKTFLHNFHNNTRSDRKYCFILGSGASRSSGIPTGGELVKDWMSELTKMHDSGDLTAWKKENKITEKNLAEHYSMIFDKRFELDPKEGFDCLEKAMDGKEPSCGYSVLAHILAQKQHNIVVTTNFDSLTEDALFIYTKTKPLVVGHEALAHYIKPLNSRPTIVKIHRDLFFTPKNTLSETKALETKFETNMTSLFKHYTPLVIGYGGNDGSLMGFLEELDEIEGGIFWFYRKEDGELNARIKKLIKKFNGRAIPIPSFDDLMFQLGSKSKLEFLHKKIIEIAEQRAKTYQEQILALNKNKDTSPETKEVVSDMTLKSEKDWWYYEVKASKEEDIDKRDKIYQEGIEKLPKSAELIGNYALFLRDVKKDYGRAEEFFKKTIKIDPNYVNNIGNYANFLTSIRREHDKAEKLHKKAIVIKPTADHIGNYALFLHEVRKEYDEAEKLYKKAIDMDSTNALNIGNYANFLTCIRREHDKAEKLYKKAIKIDPNHANNIGNYAVFLQHIRKRYDEAEKLYKKAIEIDPNNATHIKNYAILLKKMGK